MPCASNVSALPSQADRRRHSGARHTALKTAIIALLAPPCCRPSHCQPAQLMAASCCFAWLRRVGRPSSMRSADTRGISWPGDGAPFSDLRHGRRRQLGASQLGVCTGLLPAAVHPGLRGRELHSLQLRLRRCRRRIRRGRSLGAHVVGLRRANGDRVLSCCEGRTGQLGHHLRRRLRQLGRFASCCAAC